MACIHAKHCKYYVTVTARGVSSGTHRNADYQFRQCDFNSLYCAGEKWAARTDTHHWARPVAWKGITFLCLRHQSFERDLDFLWFSLLQGRWEQPARLRPWLNPTQLLPAQKQVSIVLLDGRGLTRVGEKIEQKCQLLPFYTWQRWAGEPCL